MKLLGLTQEIKVVHCDKGQALDDDSCNKCKRSVVASEIDDNEEDKTNMFYLQKYSLSERELTISLIDFLTFSFEMNIVLLFLTRQLHQEEAEGKKLMFSII